MDLRSDHMESILKIEPVKRIFSFPTVLIKDIFALGIIYSQSKNIWGEKFYSLSQLQSICN